MQQGNFGPYMKLNLAFTRFLSYLINQLLRGDSGILLTRLPKEEVQRIFEEYEDYDFARTGSVATEKVELKEGSLEQFTHEMEPFLRKQGMPGRLNKGVVEIVFIICEEGKPISPESSRILRLLGIKMATFKLYLVCRRSSEEFEVYTEGLEDSDIESSYDFPTDIEKGLTRDGTHHLI